MVWVKDELWFINICFFCFCIFGYFNSFVFRWWFFFVIGYDLIDWCYLNGFCLKNDLLKYVIVLGEIDIVVGWRKNKVNGGILIDIEINEVLIWNLFMFYFFRWY